MKKVISILLCLAIAFSAASAAAAAGVRKNVPKVYISGFGRTDLIVDKGEPTEDQVFLPSMDRLKSALVELAFPLTMFLFFNNDDYFARELVKTANQIFKEIEFNNDGEPVYDNISLEFESNAYMFRYDFRYDVMDTAKILNEYIEQIKADNGAEKVALIPESMGGAVTLAYLYTYGYDSVDTVIFRSTAMMGISFMGEVFTKNIHINPDGVTGFINSFIQGQGSDRILLRALVKNIGKIPVTVLANRLNRFFDKEKDYIYENSMYRMFGNIPGIWTFVPSEYYEEAKRTMLDEDLNKKLIEKIDVYQYQVKPAAPEMFRKMQADGVKIAVLSNYGFYGVPLMENNNVNTDFLVDTKYSSIGATCTEVGGSFEDGYVQKIDDGYDHISADNQIDASTCLLPMNTWFIKGMIHTWYTDGYYDLIDWIIYDSDSARVDENPLYPQFLYDNVETEELDILTAQSPDPIGCDVTPQIFTDGIKGLFSKKS